MAGTSMRFPFNGESGGSPLPRHRHFLARNGRVLEVIAFGTPLIQDSAGGLGKPFRNIGSQFRGVRDQFGWQQENRAMKLG